jgi:hypothetical protein
MKKKKKKKREREREREREVAKTIPHLFIFWPF